MFRISGLHRNGLLEDERLGRVVREFLELSRRFRKSIVSFAQPGQLFEDLGITYIGVVPGHACQPGQLDPLKVRAIGGTVPDRHPA